MDNAIVKTTIMKNMTPKLLTVMLLSVISSTALLGCSQQSDDVETIASEQEQDSITTNDYQASRNTGAWGAVYMSREELTEPNVNIVDVSSLPNMENDPSIAKWEAKFEGENAFITTDGKKLYHDSCAACHMHKGEGAYGAGYYPPLADNSKMESKYYIIDILINGFRGMPSFHGMMNDEQMAAVTQYIVNDLNGFNEIVTAEDVAQLRHEKPPASDPSDE
ncbi:MAG: c-type cytochrome [Psychrobacter sp.]|jgi:mono/diheme cytochrome c family protein|uniref:c-type cytochrome n=1 Tax=uncultured Psychrobacter sp. TaxID=259303 RepID=UPI0023B4A685|nr:cytochrome c [uncultured Psychrobacter sp.]|tara:strand:+ start:363 stop:1025 length:663 start_codon:yes stop_codon:yes gene_type:complete